MGSENSKFKTNSTEKDAQAKLTEGIVNEIVWEMTFETRNRTNCIKTKNDIKTANPISKYSKLTYERCTKRDMTG